MNKQTRTLAVLAILVVVCLGGYFALRSWNQTQEEAEHTYLARMSQVSHITYDKDGLEMGFTLDGEDVWVYDGDETFPIDGDDLSAIAALFESLEAQRVITQPEALSSYGLDQPQRTVTAEGQSADSESSDAVTILLGDEVNGAYYAMVEGDETTVYTIPSDLFDKTDCTLLQLGQPEQLPSLKEENVEAVALSQNGQAVSLTKTTQTETIETGETGEDGSPETQEITQYTWYLDGAELPQDSQAMDDLLSALAQLNFTQCLAYKSAQEELEAMGLAGEDTLTLTVTYSGGQTLTLLCGIDTGEESGSVYAMQEGSDMVHALSSSTADTLSGLIQADWTAVPESEEES